jgi:hypothetical protein
MSTRFLRAIARLLAPWRTIRRLERSQVAATSCATAEGRGQELQNRVRSKA